MNRKQRKPYNMMLMSISMMLGLSVMYSVYVFGFDQGKMEAGSLQRTLMKFLFSLMFFFSIRRYVDKKSFLLNLALKLPIVFLVLFSVVGVLAFLYSPDAYDSSYAQALNIVFFAPILFVDWNKSGGDQLYRDIWKTIALIAIIQVITDPLLKAYTNVHWEDNALIGGMGNPNVFGLFLIIAAVYVYTFVASPIKLASIPLSVIPLLTGSLVCSLIGLSFAAFVVLNEFIYSNRRVKLLLACLLLALTFLALNLVNMEMTGLLAATHAFGKIEGLLTFFAVHDPSQAGSIAGRIAYVKDGFDLMKDSPLSLIFGHPGFLPMFNGDGLWISVIVTHGIPFTLLFFSTNIYVIFRSSRYKKPEFVFSFFVLIIMQLFFITNRILDYWPAALIYLLPFCYCAVRNVRGRVITDVDPATLDCAVSR